MVFDERPCFNNLFDKRLKLYEELVARLVLLKWMNVAVSLWLLKAGENTGDAWFRERRDVLLESRKFRELCRSVSGMCEN